MCYGEKVAAFDVQGFMIEKKFIPKEIAILDESYRSVHFILKPPRKLKSIYALNDKDMRQTTWLTDMYHGIHWTEGIVEYEDLDSIISPILEKFTTIYVCGQQKEAFLDRLKLSGKVIDLRIVSDEFPKLSDNPNNEHNRCMCHSPSLKNMCARKNVYNITAFFHSINDSKN